MNTNLFAISLNPRTYKGGGGGGCHPPNKVFSKFGKDDLL